MRFDLTGQVVLVTGASRGIGKGIAIELGACGAIVYVTGRSTDEQDTARSKMGTIDGTAREVEQSGGKCTAIRCDHKDDAQVKKVFEQIISEQGKIDILVNNVWGGYRDMVERIEGENRFTWIDKFWNQPDWRWEEMFQAGVRAHYISSQLAAKEMVARRKGLIVNLSYWAAQTYMGNVAYGVSKAATDKMIKDMAVELNEFGVAAVSLYPGLVRTELVMNADEPFDLSNSQSPRFIGRAIAALATDGQILRKSGEVLIAAELGLTYGFADTDGQQPRPESLSDFQ